MVAIGLIPMNSNELSRQIAFHKLLDSLRVVSTTQSAKISNHILSILTIRLDIRAAQDGKVM